MSNLTPDQIAPRTGRAIALAIGMMLLVQAGYMVLDLALRKLVGSYVGEVGLTFITALLLGLGAFIGINRACVRYPFADRSAILATLVGVAVVFGAIGLASGAGLASFAVAFAIHGGYTLAQIIGGWIAVHRSPRRDWSTRW